jgi:hypothetical protein
VLLVIPGIEKTEQAALRGLLLQFLHNAVRQNGLGKQVTPMDAVSEDASIGRHGIATADTRGFHNSTIIELWKKVKFPKKAENCSSAISDGC